MMRWWWFGPAVEKNELARELRTMKAGGIGGVEVQPVYALDLDDPQKGFRNLPFLSKDFLDMLELHGADRARLESAAEYDAGQRLAVRRRVCASERCGGTAAHCG